MIVTPRTASAALIAIAAMAYASGAGAQVPQPHMQKALADLQSARSELNAAAHDKGGHRGRAVQLVDEAIGEVRAGMAAGRQYEARHPH
jgi:hypothetical protein